MFTIFTMIKIIFFIGYIICNNKLYFKLKYSLINKIFLIN